MKLYVTPFLLMGIMLSATPTTPSSSAGVTGENISCPMKVDHVLIEKGNHKPFPILLIPDWYNNKETPQEGHQEWNFVNYDDLTVHCHDLADPKKVVDVKLPKGLKKCAFLRTEFYCR